MAAMSVIGIDLGNESCYVAVAKAGGIETIANDYSLRATPSCIAFSDKNRILGVAAKNQQVTNMKNTVYGLKRIIGRKFKDPQVQKELELLPFNIIEIAQGNIGIKVRYLNEEQIFSPEQCMAMLLTKLKEISTVALQTPINDCVISVPSYFTNNERKALLDSASIAGLNVLRLFNETTATALAYGIYKQDLPGPDGKPRNVFFVDCGHSSLQVFACAFTNDKLRMICTTSDRNLGGRDFDILLADYFCKDFQTRYKIDPKTNARAYLRLLTEVEKLKKQMSANSTTLPVNIECFMNDKDVHGTMKRTDMEQLCNNLFNRIELTMKQCLEQSGLTLNDIHSVEIVGGSTRIPGIKQLIENVFKKIPSTTLNQDEAVSRGCALQCAMLSPAVRVREFSIKDVQSYPVSVSWDASSDGETAGEVEAFPVNHVVPYSKMLTFYRQEPFSVRALYSGNIPYPDRNIGQWIIKNIHPTVDGKPQKVKVKVRINIHGIMTVSSASLYEIRDSPEPCETGEESNQQQNEQNQQQQNQNPQQQQNQNSEQQNDADAPMADATTNNSTSEDGDKKKKQTTKSIELPIEALTAGFSQVEINQYTEQEYKMIAADKQEKERIDARNAFEEYVYELRNKLSSDYNEFILDNDRNLLLKELDDWENWLYEEGEDCTRQIYQDKLSELKLKGEPIRSRKDEANYRPIIIEEFVKTLQNCMKSLERIKANDPVYAHLTDEDVKKLDSALKQSYEWLDKSRSKSSASPKHLPPPITISQFRQEKMNFENIVNPILNKPPPKAPSPPKDEQKTNNDDNKKESSNEQQQQNQQQPQQQNQSQENMEWSSN